MRRNTSSLTFILGGILLAGLLAFSAPSFGAEPEVPTSHPQLNSAVHPEESAAEKELNGGVGTLIATIAVFLGLLVVLRATAWKPIMAGLKGREDAIRNSIEGAKRAKADAERTTKELEAKMAEVQRQASLQMTQAKNDAVKIAASIRASAEAESAALKDRTLREIDAAKQQALGEINTHAAMLGTAVASKILKRQVTVDDQQRLVEESLAELAKKN
jgi:F-type H+-transporting ATPase subunit b